MAWESNKTETLLALRANMIRGAVSVATQPDGHPEARALVPLQVALVDSIDVALAERGVKVTPPLWV